MHPDASCRPKLFSLGGGGLVIRGNTGIADEAGAVPAAKGAVPAQRETGFHEIAWVMIKMSIFLHI